MDGLSGEERMRIYETPRLEVRPRSGGVRGQRDLSYRSDDGHTSVRQYKTNRTTITSPTYRGWYAADDMGESLAGEQVSSCPFAIQATEAHSGGTANLPPLVVQDELLYPAVHPGCSGDESAMNRPDVGTIPASRSNQYQELIEVERQRLPL